MSRRRRRVLQALGWTATAVIVAVAALLVWRLDPPRRHPLSDNQRWETHHWRQGFVERSWVVGVPPDMAPGRRPALVLLHGALGDNTVFGPESDLFRFTVPRGIVVAAPQGLWGVWNTGNCCLPATAAGVDDIGFIDHVIAELVRRPDVDPRRIYVVGASNGGMLAIRYACEGHEPVAGAASVIGPTADATGCGSRSVPLLLIAGTEDTVTPYDGGRTPLGMLLSGGGSTPGAQEAAAALAAANGCSEEYVTTASSAWTTPEAASTRWTVQRWQGCRAPVDLVTIEGVEHTWPWGGWWGASQQVLSFLGLL